MIKGILVTVTLLSSIGFVANYSALENTKNIISVIPLAATEATTVKVEPIEVAGHPYVKFKPFEIAGHPYVKFINSEVA